VARQTFHPFYHEIVAVEQASDPDEPLSLVAEVWPGFMLGSLMICRAGVRVRGGTAHVVKEIAEHPTLYWTYWRRNRPHADLSHGWGSNSQWGTRFRRDYVDGTVFYYNVDGRLDAALPDVTTRPTPNREELEPEERIELLTHRCFIRTSTAHSGRWPYDDTYVERAPDDEGSGGRSRDTSVRREHGHRIGERMSRTANMRTSLDEPNGPAHR
jgi:hypothetical protein